MMMPTRGWVSLTCAAKLDPGQMPPEYIGLPKNLTEEKILNQMCWGTLVPMAPF